MQLSYLVVVVNVGSINQYNYYNLFNCYNFLREAKEKYPSYNHLYYIKALVSSSEGGPVQTMFGLLFRSQRV